MSAPDCTIVLPTHNRPALLARLVVELRQQLGDDSVTVVVVDDGSTPAVRLDIADERFRVLRTDGLGPAGARNIGWRAASTGWIAFLDDDVLPRPGWWRAVADSLGGDAVAVEGRVVSEPFDPLRERSIVRESGGWGLTCNVAYRRSALEAVDGFDEDFPAAHCEDLDLFMRIRERGATRFRDDMVVEHFKRPFGPRGAWRRGTWVGSEIRLARKHPGIFSTPDWVPTPVLPLLLVLTEWCGRLAEERAPRRIVRLVSLASIQTVATGRTLVRDAARARRRGGR